MARAAKTTPARQRAGRRAKVVVGNSLTEMLQAWLDRTKKKLLNAVQQGPVLVK